MKRAYIISGLILAIASAPAAGTSLTCEPRTAEAWLVEDSPTIFDIDEASSTVTVHVGAFHCGPNPEISCPAHPAETVGPLKAAFGDTEISFIYDGRTYVINRLNGAVRGQELLLGVGRWACHPATKQF